jgi:hypothetical protein
MVMVKELSIVLGIDHQELPEHPSDQNKELYQFIKTRLFSNTPLPPPHTKKKKSEQHMYIFRIQYLRSI